MNGLKSMESCPVYIYFWQLYIRSYWSWYKLSESGIPKKFEEIKTEIEKAVIPHITVKIFMPEGVDKEEFLKLEKDEEFLRALGDFTEKWLKKGKSKKTA